MARFTLPPHSTGFGLFIHHLRTIRYCITHAASPMVAIDASMAKAMSEVERVAVERDELPMRPARPAIEAGEQFAGRVPTIQFSTAVPRHPHADRHTGDVSAHRFEKSPATPS